MTDHIVHDDGPGFLSNAIAVIAFVVVIAIVLWGLLHLAGISTSWFTSLFPRSVATISVAAPAGAQSDTPFAVNWKYTPAAGGSYALLYQCRTGLSLHTADAAGATVNIPCGAAYSTGATSTLTVTPHLTGTTTAALPLTIVFLPNDNSAQAQGSATVTITTSSAARASGTAAGTTAYTETTSATQSNTSSQTVSDAAPADLALSIISADTLGGLTTVTFDVRNIGGRASGTYTFTASLPTGSGYSYESPTQYSLGAGAHVVNTLQFSDSVGGTFTAALNANDAHQYNNTDSISVGGTYTPIYDYAYPTYDYNQYNQQYYYPQTQYAQPSYPYLYPNTSYQYPTYDYNPYYQPQLPDETGYGTYYAQPQYMY